MLLVQVFCNQRDYTEHVIIIIIIVNIDISTIRFAQLINSINYTWLDRNGPL